MKVLMNKLRFSRQLVFLALFELCLFPQILFGVEFTWTAERQTAELAEGKEFTRLWGGATVNSGGTLIEAEEIELSGTDFRYAFCRGGVRVVDEERGIILEADSLYYDREEEITRVDGYVEMQDLKNEVVVKGGFLEHFGKEEIAIIQIGVRILKVSEDSEMASHAEFARYDRNSETLELSGTPRVTWKGDEYRATRISVDLQTDEIFLDGSVSGSITEDEEESTEGSAQETAAETEEAPEPPQETGTAPDEQ